MNALVSQILPQLQSKVASPLFNRAHAIEWLEHGYGLQSSVSLNTAKRFESALDKYTVEVTGVTFVAGPEEDAIPAHQNILRKLKRVRFKNCTFECDHLSLPGVTQWFENCRVLRWLALIFEVVPPISWLLVTVSSVAAVNWKWQA